MATTNVMQSLFGVSNPAQAQQEYMGNYMVSPAQLGQQGLLQQLVSLGGNAGAMIGTGAGRLFGGMTPQEAEQRRIQGLFGGASLTDADQLSQAAERFAQAGDVPRAQALMGQAQELRTAQAAQAEAAAKKQAEQQRLDSLAQVVMEKTGLSPEEALALAQDPAAVRELMKTETTVVETAKGQVLVDKNTGKEIKNLGPAPDRRNITNVNVSNTAENEYAKKVGAGVAERDLTYLDTTTATAKTLPKIEETLKLINSGQINTGLAKDIQDGIAKVRAQVLKDKAAGKNVSDSEYLDSLLGSDTFAQIPLLGLGAKGMDTPAERDFILSVITGQRNLSLDTLRRMTEFRRDAALRQVGDYNQRLAAGEFDQYQSTTGRKLKPIEVKGAPSKPAASSSVRSAADAILQGK